MDTLETGKDKLKKICDLLRVETLDPARNEARAIIDNAKMEAEKILDEAEEKRAEILKKAKEEREKEKELFESTLKGAASQTILYLKQAIEEKLFNTELISWVESQTSSPDVAAQLISSLVKAIEKEGVSADFSAAIAESISREKVNALLGGEIVKKLREKKVIPLNIAGGVQIRLHDKKMVLDLSDKAITELLSQYVRKEFRKILFHE